jgi:N-acyl-D-aspartate/D-glutamate deacylase
MLAGETAGYAGFRDRGVLKVGLRADLNVIDLERLAVKRPRMVRDLPAGGQRLLQDASGYRATVVRGEVVVENDRLTSARPGRLARITA